MTMGIGLTAALIYTFGDFSSTEPKQRTARRSSRTNFTAAP